MSKATRNTTVMVETFDRTILLMCNSTTKILNTTVIALKLSLVFDLFPLQV